MRKGCLLLGDRAGPGSTVGEMGRGGREAEGTGAAGRRPVCLDRVRTRLGDAKGPRASG